jgi:hypothetical protein
VFQFAVHIMVELKECSDYFMTDLFVFLVSAPGLVVHYVVTNFVPEMQHWNSSDFMEV